MKPIEELLKNLGRAEVLEFGLVTNRLPSVNIGGKFAPVDDEAPTTEVLLQMLVTMGGTRYVEQLSERPVQWTTRLDGVGVIAVAAIMRKDIVQARFTVARRDASSQSKAPAALSQSPPSTSKQAAAQQVAGQPAGAQPSAPSQVAAKPIAPAASPASAAVAATQPKPAAGAGSVGAQPVASPLPGAVGSAAASGAGAAIGAGAAGAHSSAVQKVAPQAAPVQPRSPTPVAGPSATLASGPTSGIGPAAQPAAIAAPGAAVGAAPAGAAVPPPDDWDDDDEPTVQTLSPPVAPPQAQAAQARAAQDGAAQARAPASAEDDARPKPARKPGELGGAATAADAGADERKLADERKAAEERAASERKALEERAALDERKAAEERAALDERKAAEERERNAAEERERKAAEERAAHERKVIEERAAAERKAAEERKQAEQRNAAERAAAEGAATERAAAEKRAAIERAAAERAVAAERAAAERKAAERAKVERRISTPTSVDAVDVEITTSDSGTRPVAGGLELEGLEDAAATPAHQQALRAPAATPSHVVPSAIPSATPTGAVVAEKDRPRGDGALDSFLAMAVAAHATDVHVVAGRPLLLRVASELLPRTQPVEPEHVERIAREIVPRRLRELLEVEGACDFALDHPQHGRFRVNVSRQRTGYKLSMRVIPREVPTLASLGLPEGVAAAAKPARGLVLFTGPAGSGKTTTLAAVIDLLNRETTRHILTVEDPIELVHVRKRALVSQREIGTHARSLGAAIEASFREDADVLVLGELRDAAGLRAALTASETGHLVLATVNTPSAAKTVDRLIEMFPPSEQPQIRSSLANALRLVVGQRLVPSADRTRLHAAVELLPSSIALYTLIRDARTFQIPSLQQRGRALGVIRLDESLAELVKAQNVTLEIAKQHAESPQELEAHATRNASGAAARKA